MDVHEILRMFCCRDDEIRTVLNNPFNHGNYTYATNGHFGIRVPKIEQYQNDDAKYDMDKMGFGVVDDKLYTDIPDVNKLAEWERCDECDGEGRDYKCPECYGSTVVFLESKLGTPYRADCEYTGCNRGVILGVCEQCNGKGKVSTVRGIEVGTKLIDVELLNTVSMLPGVKIATEAVEDSKPIPFKFDGGDGIIMPLRKFPPVTPVKQNETI